MKSSRRKWLFPIVTPPSPLRPPGAREEKLFAALCIRCNRCVEVCPYKTLKPAGLKYGSKSGTPLFIPRDVPCYLCMDCPPECPTEALLPIEEKRQVAIGIAKVNQKTCFAYQGILCRTCVDECPFQGDAIKQNADLLPIVTEQCVGCGICERVPLKCRGFRSL